MLSTNDCMVSIVIVVRNEENYIIECIQSIERQFDDTKIRWELILVDGVSNDNTVDFAENYLKNKKFEWSIYSNSKSTLATGWNIGIKNAKGKYILRPDAHATINKGYIENGLKLLEKNPEITAVGGVLYTQSKGFWGSIIKLALSSKLGVGNSSFRTNSASGFYDTAVYALYRKEVFQKVGYLNEDLIRHQDVELHKRIKSIGGKFYLSTSMQANYYCRSSLPSLYKQMHDNGLYLPQVISSLSLRHFVPFTFCTSLFIFLLLSLFNVLFFYIFSLLFFIYTFALIINSLYYFKDNNLKSFYLLLVIPIIHFAYAFGTLRGLIKYLRL